MSAPDNEKPITIFSGYMTISYDPNTETYKLSGHSPTGGTTITAEWKSGETTITVNNNLGNLR